MHTSGGITMQELNEIKYKFYTHEELKREEIEYMIKLVEEQQREINILKGQVSKKMIHLKEY